MSRTRLLRERLLHPAAEVLGVADRLGRVMLTTNLEGATHERIGIVSRVDRIEARLKLAKLPRNGAPTRIRNRCEVTGRPRAYYRKLKMSRIALRELGSQGQIPGLDQSRL